MRLLVGICSGLLLCASFGVNASEAAGKAPEAPAPGHREKAVACAQGLIAVSPGKSLGDLFPGEWPDIDRAQPFQAARLVRSGNPPVPRELLPLQPLRAEVAVLVGADGKPLRAVPVCLSDMRVGRWAKQMAMQSKYEAARRDAGGVVDVVLVGFGFDL